MIYIYHQSVGDGGFDWDDANAAHVARHGVQASEAEQALSNDPVTIQSAVPGGGEPRWVSVGATDAGRLLVVVWTERTPRVRVVTAYPAAKKLREAYANAKQLGKADNKNGSAVQD